MSYIGEKKESIRYQERINYSKVVAEQTRTRKGKEKKNPKIIRINNNKQTFVNDSA